ncbi:DUF4266 domain-containing protein [Undibacterium sp. TS12]|uniref:DUF4266 domain-containing protein n=1 Tax=Undibacterium sp. TS12 TaxID=2908202 RepID=UPI001F4CB34F|nr:DUF4266 domain-containing protein [Undibacterium sp. TS12]MCH8621513.1 DUF4266 domain-containing protein [Undibacterium sp. TS12]
MTSKRGKQLLHLSALLGSICLCTACSSMIQPVQAWEKGKLAKKAMTFDADALENKFAEHTYSSKESAFGGNGVGGGGCGCN